MWHGIKGVAATAASVILPSWWTAHSANRSVSAATPPAIVIGQQNDAIDSTALQYLVAEQAMRLRNSEVKAVGILQFMALLFAGWNFAASESEWLETSLLILALAYMGFSLRSTLVVLSPSVRHVVGLAECSGHSTWVTELVASYHNNLSTEIRLSNLVMAGLLDAVRSGILIALAAALSLIGL